MREPYPQAHTVWQPFNTERSLENILSPTAIYAGSPEHQRYIDGIEGVMALYRRGITDPHHVSHYAVVYTACTDRAIYDIMERSK